MVFSQENFAHTFARGCKIHQGKSYLPLARHPFDLALVGARTRRRAEGARRAISVRDSPRAVPTFTMSAPRAAATASPVVFSKTTAITASGCTTSPNPKRGAAASATTTATAPTEVVATTTPTLVATPRATTSTRVIRYPCLDCRLVSLGGVGPLVFPQASAITPSPWWSRVSPAARRQRRGWGRLSSAPAMNCIAYQTMPSTRRGAPTSG